MDLYGTDLEYMERLSYFLSHDVASYRKELLDDQSKYLCVLASLIGCQGVDAYKEVLIDALEHKVTPVMIKEIVYQATDYVGYGRMLPFLNATNDVFVSLSISIPLCSQATTTIENRLEKGIEAQVKIFGEHMKDAWKDSKINQFLASNCFGDYYTRNGLTLVQREQITFCYLMAQGGCEPQLIAHAKGNMNLGTSAEVLNEIVLQCLPYVGYPRSLNALSCIKKAEN